MNEKWLLAICTFVMGICFGGVVGMMYGDIQGRSDSDNFYQHMYGNPQEYVGTILDCEWQWGPNNHDVTFYSSKPQGCHFADGMYVDGPNHHPVCAPGVINCKDPVVDACNPECSK